ncbi:type II toxin-antitoxin system HipA family toxin [Neptuniibacter sp. QD37_11]|uniref:type II toxin-antitoxin system HipA family toxin n=1 Tax=Neptuniibacter sp. QD37_11 TaxID=3398209 RepID=UPI0039F4C1E4
MEKNAVIWIYHNDQPLKIATIRAHDYGGPLRVEIRYVPKLDDMPGLSAMLPPSRMRDGAIIHMVTELEPLPVVIRHLVPPNTNDNFQRRLLLASLRDQNISPPAGFETDWALLMYCGHGTIGHLNVFESDELALQWFNERESVDQFFAEDSRLTEILSEHMQWLNSHKDDHVARAPALGGSPNVGGMIPKILASIHRDGYRGTFNLPQNRPAFFDETYTDVIIKYQPEKYQGMAALEAFSLAFHKQLGFEVPRYWFGSLNKYATLLVERFDRDIQGRPLYQESLFSVLNLILAKEFKTGLSSSFLNVATALTASNLPLNLSMIQREHFFDRLCLALLTGNGDLHLENLSFCHNGGEYQFTPVYDSTPMAAFAGHTMYLPLELSNKGDCLKNGYLAPDIKDQLIAVGLEIGLKNASFRVDKWVGKIPSYLAQLQRINEDFIPQTLEKQASSHQLSDDIIEKLQVPEKRIKDLINRLNSLLLRF